ncbi:MurR/RpiR family transcriptional regulator [Clostridium sp. CM028]|uniref:MurR/RpiR family transcriptional regulator n=1 Tax=Clostridium sp. CM028 TaxID=2851575 RepID=UPI001C6F4AE0|nr:MurR/RpiR family transcriptional regulator [Clostridium sp. CM028]MBW9150198.1 MurR/RpiR family transcriptional regulator [Clostridium sp. CM028]WLC60361.1 MurR/RpiR family transcriptional regulator [Clostridium sp. CM028]
MGVLLNRLLTMLNDSPPKSTDYHIVLTLLMNFHSLYDMTISEVAKLCIVSKSTISKFIRSIDFEDYASFRTAAAFKQNKYGFKLNYNQNIAEYIEEKGMDSYLEIIHKDIEECKKFIDMNKIDELAKYLIKYKKVASFGLLFSEIATLDLQTKLAYNGKFIITNLNDVKQDQFINNAKEDTLIIIFSNSGSYMQRYQLSEFQITKSFLNTKAKIVLITSNKEMEKLGKVDLCINFKHTTNVQTHSIIFQLINDYITLRYRQLTRKKE